MILDHWSFQAPFKLPSKRPSAALGFKARAQMAGAPHYQGHSIGQQEKSCGTLGITSNTDYDRDYRANGGRLDLEMKVRCWSSLQ